MPENLTAPPEWPMALEFVDDREALEWGIVPLVVIRLLMAMVPHLERIARSLDKDLGRMLADARVSAWSHRGWPPSDYADDAAAVLLEGEIKALKTLGRKATAPLHKSFLREVEGELERAWGALYDGTMGNDYPQIIDPLAELVQRVATFASSQEGADVPGQADMMSSFESMKQMFEGLVSHAVLPLDNVHLTDEGRATLVNEHGEWEAWSDGALVTTMSADVRWLGWLGDRLIGGSGKTAWLREVDVETPLYEVEGVSQPNLVLSIGPEAFTHGKWSEAWTRFGPHEAAVVPLTGPAQVGASDAEWMVVAHGRKLRFHWLATLQPTPEGEKAPKNRRRKQRKLSGIVRGLCSTPSGVVVAVMKLDDNIVAYDPDDETVRWKQTVAGVKGLAYTDGCVLALEEGAPVGGSGWSARGRLHWGMPAVVALDLDSGAQLWRVEAEVVHDVSAAGALVELQDRRFGLVDPTGTFHDWKRAAIGPLQPPLGAWEMNR